MRKIQNALRGYYALLFVCAVAVIAYASGYLEVLGGASLAMAYARPNEVLVRVPPGTEGSVKGPNNETVLRIGLDAIERTPMNRFLGFMDNIIGARTQIFYDSIVMVAGTALAGGSKVNLFTEGLDGDGKRWNTGTTYQKTRIHTNMIEDGQFEYGVSAIVVGFELLFMSFPAKAAVATDGIVTDSLDHAAQPAGYNQSQFTRALMLQNRYTFRRGSDVSEENGLLIDLPSNAGLSGSFGAQATNGICQNSLGPNSMRVLEYPKVLHSSENFSVEVEALASSFAIPVVCVPPD